MWVFFFRKGVMCINREYWVCSWPIFTGRNKFSFLAFFLLIIVKRPCLLGLGFHILFVNNKNIGSGPTQSPALHYHNKWPNCFLIYFILKKRIIFVSCISGCVCFLVDCS